MYKTKKDVDKYVEALLSKVPAKEFKNRALSIANLYFNVGDYVNCQKYVEQYLTQKSNNAAAYRLFGQALHKLGQKEKALDQYKTSLDIDPTHASTILDICELLADDTVAIEPGRAKYWCEKAEATFPRHPVTFRLRERLLNLSNSDPEALVNLLNKELTMRPKDVTLHIRLIKHYLHTYQFKEAFEHACDIEFSSNTFVNNHNWYETLSTLFQQNCNNTNDWLYQLLLLTTRERIFLLSLTETTSGTSRSLVETNELLHEYDQALEIIAKAGAPSGFGEFHSALLQHHRGQFAFHAATFLLKKAKKDQISWSDAKKYSAPLMLLAWHTLPIDLKVNWLKLAPEKQTIAANRWYSEGAYRCSQAGHYLLSNVRDKSQGILDQISQCCSGTHWKDKIYEKVFTSRAQLSKIKSSYFVSHDFGSPILRLPRKVEVEALDDDAQKEYPNSLHHFVWILSNYKNYAHFKCVTFDMLSSSVTSFGPESLNKLDIEAFLYCATLTSQQKIGAISYIAADRPLILPANITDLSCTLPQLKWWDCAYKFSQNELGSELTDIRSTLTRGIEAVRCVDSHGLDPELLCTLGHIFTEKAKLALVIDDKNHLNERAALYYASAIPVLEKIINKMVVKIPNRRMFDYTHKELGHSELHKLIEESKVFIAIQNFHNQSFQKVIDILSTVKTYKAYLYLAQTYKQIALEELNTNKTESQDSQSKFATVLTKAKHFAFKALDKLKETDTDKDDCMYSDTQELLEEIETLLNKTDSPGVNNNQENRSYLSDENISYDIRQTREKSHTYRGVSSTPKPLYRFDNTNYHTANDSQLMKHHLDNIETEIINLKKRDISVSDLMEVTKTWFEENLKLGNQIMSTINTNIENTNEQFRFLKISMDQVKDQINECKNDCKDVVELKKQIESLKKEVDKLKKSSSDQTAVNENDLPKVDEDYRTNETATNLTSQLPFNTPPIVPQFNQRLVTPFHVPPNPYQIYNQSLYNLYNQYSQFTQPPPMPGASLFDPPRPQANYTGIYPTAEQMYLDVAPLVGANAPAVPGMQSIPVIPPLAVIPTAAHAPIVSVATVPVSAPTLKNTNIDTKDFTKNLPVNVVITSSDPLPTCTTTPAPVLSVTIPSKHIKNTPHNYQISLPSSNVNKIISPPVFSFPTAGNNNNTNTLPIWNQQSVFKTVQPNFSTSSNELSVPQKTEGFGVNNLSQVLNKTADQTTSNTSINKSRTLSEKSNTSVENYDPCPDFKPIVPLPAEVKVTTGEEEESIIFNARAKLFRFVDKQWKERGIGQMKLLKHNITGKVRVLMRREQIHKICANHIITSEMEIKPMKNENKAYFWVANDYADEVLILEKFCIRFKTCDIAQEFYQTFENARQESLNQSTSEISNTSTVSEINTLTTPLKAVIEETVAQSTGKAVVGGFTFTSTPTFKPVLEEKSNIKLADTSANKVNIFSGLSFKTTSAAPFSNLFKTAGSPVASGDINLKQEPANKLNLSDTVEDFEPTVDFKPVVPLPAVVELKTGEEDEVVLFEHRAKLFRYDFSTKEWKERGLGNIKLLVNKDNHQKVRLLMRREQIMKVCCNHIVTKEMDFQKKPMSDKEIVWCAIDFSEGETVTETFCLRFKTSKICSDFLEAVKQAQSKLKDASKAAKEESNAAKQIIQSGFGDKFKPAEGSWYCEACYTNNLESFKSCGCCEQPKPGLSNTTKDGVLTTSESKSASQNISKFSFGNENKPVSNVVSQWGDKFKPKSGSWECQNCFVRNDSGLDICCACNSHKDPSKQKSDSANNSINLTSSNTTKFNFGIPSQTLPKMNTQQEIPKTVPANESTGWGENFKLKDGAWECKGCYVRNESSNSKCCSCDKPKEDNANVPTGNTFNFGTLMNMNNNGNTKQEISSIFDGTGAHKFSFGIPKTITKPSTVEPFGNFGSIKLSGNTNEPVNLTNKTLSGNSASEIIAAKPALLPTPENVNTTFKLADKESSSFGFVFKPKTPPKGKSPLKSPKSDAGDESDDSTVHPEDDHIGQCFTPVVPLPDKVEVVTGEEDEIELYGHRAKLYRYTSGEWKERGIGIVKILKHKDTGKLRVVMRREQVLKICLNHSLLPEIIYKPKDEKTWLFAANDFSEGEFSLDQFCLRFKSKEIAIEFKNAIDKSLDRLTDDKETSDNRVESKDGSEDVVFVSETQATAEQKQKAKELMLPENFFTYTNKEPCLGCRGCDADSDKNKPIVTETSTLPTSNAYTPVKSTTPATQSPTSSFYGTPNTLDKTGDTTIFRTPCSVTKSSTTTVNKDTTFAKSLINKENTIQGIKSSLFGTEDKIKPNKDESKIDEKTTQSSGAAAGGKSFILAAPKLVVQTTLNKTENVNTEQKPQFSLASSKTTETKSSVAPPLGMSNNYAFGSKPSSISNANQADSKPEVKSIFGGIQKTDNIFSTSFQGSIFGPGALNNIQTKPIGGGLFGSQSQAFDSAKFSFGTASTNQESIWKVPDDKVSNIFTTNTVKETDKEKDKKEAELPMAAKNLVTFTDLSNASSGFKTDPNFQWQQAGQHVFSSPKNKDADTSKGEDATEDYDPHYEPIVPLPEKIVVVTGEEDEEKIFGERGKLYRYDDKLREWKERGVGELKILYHPGKKTYRLLLRREQVYKAVLNMLLSMDMELLPLKNSDRAWTWAGRNFAETSAGEQETLAVRFKSVELAAAFHEKVIQCVRKLQAAAAQAHEEEKSKELLKVEGVTPLRLPKHLSPSARDDETIVAKAITDSTALKVTESSPVAETDTPTQFGTVSNQNIGLFKNVVQFTIRRDETRDEDDDDDDDDEDDDDEEEDDEGNDHDYEDYYEEDEESSACFSGEGEAVIRQDGRDTNSDCARVAVLYDPEHFAPKILVTDTATGEILADMLVHTDTVFQLNDNSCSWSGIDCKTNNPVDTNITINFFSQDEAMLFYDSCETSKATTYASTDPES